ncbi:MAG: PQQ-binding-like beta-propeller repeat protein [Planctomycetota bacterium]
MQSLESSPVGKLIFAAGKNKVVGIDADTGQELWRTEIKRGFFSSSSFCTMTLQGSFLYVAAGKYVTKLDAWTGHEIWIRDSLKSMGPLPMIVAGEGNAAQTVTAAAIMQQQAQAAAAGGAAGAAAASG